jgi:GPH family glycoside/pentoside/hexuronide:cation symporter
MKTSLNSRFAYGVSDLASNLSWGTVGSFLMLYYTDVAKVPAAMIGTMFLITRIWDAINDPLMGLIVDKTNTRWGKARPYFLWMCVPLAVIMVLTYSVPAAWSLTAKMVYIYVTFTLLGMVYTAINIPVTAILPRLSNDLQERTVLGTFRGFGALIGNVLVGAATFPLIMALGAGNQAKGFQMVMVVYGCAVVALFLWTFFGVKEIAIKENATAKKVLFTDSIKAAKGNLPWLITLLVGMLLQMSLALRGAGTLYYCKYNLGNEGLIPLLGMMMMLMIVPFALLPSVSKKIGKRNTVLGGAVFSVAGYILIIAGGKSMPALIAGNVLTMIGLGFSLGLIFILIADTVEYGEWKNGVRSEGFLSAASSFGQKLGTGIGGAVAAWVLAAGGYVGDVAEQTPAALRAIVFNFAGMPLVAMALIFILMLFYKLDKVYPQMIKELAERRGVV